MNIDVFVTIKLIFYSNMVNIRQINLIFGINRILCFLHNSPNFQLFGFGRIFGSNVRQNILPKQLSVGL